MPTVHRAAGLRFVIFLDDHEPAHVHAVGLGGEAKIEIGLEPEEVRTMWVKGLSRADVSRAQREVVLEHVRFLAAWSEFHRKAT
jgi:hypothetical protein